MQGVHSFVEELAEERRQNGLEEHLSKLCLDDDHPIEFVNPKVI
jgi:hypothetical protein